MINKALPLLRVMLPPPYQRPPGAEIPAMGFSVVLKILVKAEPPFELDRLQVGTARRPRKSSHADRSPGRGELDVHTGSAINLPLRRIEGHPAGCSQPTHFRSSSVIP